MRIIASIFFIIYSSFSLGSSCTDAQRDTAEYFAEQTSKQVVSRYGAGSDVRVSLNHCSFNTYSRQFKLKATTKWKGTVSSDSYESYGEITVRLDGISPQYSEINRSKNLEEIVFLHEVTNWADFLLKIKGFGSGNRFSKQNNGTITDSQLSVEWFLKGYRHHVFAKAKDLCAIHGGKLPTEEQFKSILHSDGIEMDIPIGPFSSLTGTYWTRTLLDETFPMTISLSGDGMHMYNKIDSKNKVLCVRQSKNGF